MYNRLNTISLCLLCLVLSNWCSAQEQALNNNFDFQEGFYSTAQEFSTNSPSLLLSNFNNLDYELDAEKNMLILSAAAQREIKQKMDTAPWGLAIAGNIFIKIQQNDDKSANEIRFVKLHVIGKICYLQYKTFRTKMVMMQVHNPYTGEKVGQRQIANQELVTVKKMLDVKSGQLLDFTAENFRIWTKDDEGLRKSLNELSDRDLQKKLFKTLLIYNDRNSFYIKNK